MGQWRVAGKVSGSVGQRFRCPWKSAARDVQAKGRLQPWNSKGWRPEGLVAAAARKQCSIWRWKLPRGSWRVLRVLRVLSVWSLANGRLECPNKRGLWSLANGRLECPNKRGLCAGKGQAAMLERWRPRAWWKLPRGMCRKRAGCKPGTAKADGQRAWWKLPRGSWRVLRVLSVWSLANGRPECPNKRGLCAGKGQAANPGTAKADGQRAWWKLPRGSVQGFKGRLLTRGTAKAAGQRAWWQLPRGSSAAVARWRQSRRGCSAGGF